jgi:hypothetical protein
MDAVLREDRRNRGVVARELRADSIRVAAREPRLAAR